MGNVLVGIPTRIQVSCRRENLLEHYPTVTGTPARFILRIGWAKRSPPGRGALRLRTPADLARHFSGLFLFWAPHLAASLSIAAGSSCNSTSSTSGVPAGTAGQPLAITSLK